MPPVRLDLDKQLTTFAGEPMKQQGVEEPLTFRDVLVNSLLAELPEEHLKGTEKLRRFLLARKVYGGTAETEFDKKEVETMSQMVSQVYPILAAGQVCEVLDA